MIKSLKKSLSILLAILMAASVIAAAPLTANAESVDKYLGDELSWRLYDDGKFNLFYMPDYVMPDYSSPSEQPWYSYRNSITDVTVSGKMKNVGKNAFSELPNLKTINSLIWGVSEIGERAFYKCPKLETISIYSDYMIENIGKEAFALCNGNTLETIKLQKVKKVDEKAFYDCDSKKIKLSEGLESIGNEAFADNKEVAEVIIPESCTYVGSGAFKNCSKLKTITFLNKNCKIEDADAIPSEALIKSELGGKVEAFCVANSRTINDPYSGTVGECSWSYDLESLTLTVTGPGSTGDNKPEVWKSLSENVKKVVIKDGVKYIGNSLFYNMDNIEEVSIDGSVTEIGEKSFFSCNSLTKITLPDTLVKVGNQAFSSCSLLSECILPDSVENIGENAFSSCYILNTPLPKSLKTLGRAAFKYSGLKGELIIPNSIEDIPESAFYNCEGITSVIIGNGVKSIGEKAFYSENKLTAIISENTTSIDDTAFGYQAKKSDDPEETEFIQVYDNVKIIGIYHSAAWVYAVNNEITFESMELAEITYNANGGSGEMEKTEVQTGMEFTLPECGFTAPEGKEFDCWKIGENTYKPGGKYTVSSDTEINAVWKDKPAEKPTEQSTEPTEKPTEAPTSLPMTTTVRFLPASYTKDTSVKLVVMDTNGQYHSIDMTATPIKHEGVPVFTAELSDDINRELIQFQISEGGVDKGEVTLTAEQFGNVQDKIITSDGTAYAETKPTEATEAPKVEKKKQPMTVKAKTKTVKAKTLKKKKLTVKNSITVKKAKGTVSYKKAAKGSAKFLSISKKGVITVKKGKYKKGTYKIKVTVTANGNKTYKKGSKTVTVKIVVK